MLFKKAIVTGGAGFIGSHLVERLIHSGIRVVSIDNYIAGKKENLAHLHSSGLLDEVECDISEKEMLTPQEFRSFPRSLYAADGISPNETANLLGFNSGRDLVDAIKSNPSKEEYIRITTDQRLNQEFPNFMDPAQEEDLKVAALNAVDNDMREKALKLEFELMMQKSPAQAKALIKKIAKRLPSTKEMKQAAEARVGDTAYNQAKPYIFKRIENKTRRIAVEEFVKGNYDKAAKSKLQEIFNHNYVLL